MLRLFNEIFDKKYISPGSLGGKIRRYREMRGLTQKQLGLLCGFSDTTADVRIGQYEKNKKVPRDKALKDLAQALEIDVSALLDGDMVNNQTAYQALFDIEDFHGLHPEKKGNLYYLEFSGDSIFKTSENRKEYNAFLKAWYKMRQKCLPEANDTPEQISQKQVEYVLWKAEYPLNDIIEQSERLDDLSRMKRLQAEIDVLNARLKSDDELSKIDAELDRILPEVRKDYEHILYESEFIFIVKELLKAGIKVEIVSPSDELEKDPQRYHILSIRTKELLNNQRNMKLYTKLECAFDSIRAYDVKVDRCITSHKDELFVSFVCPKDQANNFYNLHTYWKDMIYANNSIDAMVNKDGKTLNELFIEKITGENDVRIHG